MNLLLDTHSFVWMHKEAHKLSVMVAMEILNPASVLYLSMASLWELQIKIKIGKFSFREPLAEVVAKQQSVNSLRILPIAFPHVLELENLPLHHKDPFDRMLIAQAKAENFTLVSKDPQFSAYPVDLLW